MDTRIRLQTFGTAALLMVAALLLMLCHGGAEQTPGQQSPPEWSEIPTSVDGLVGV